MRILVVDQCSASKNYRKSSRVYDIDEVDENPVKNLANKDGVAAKPARQLYSGKQQKRITEAADILREKGHSVEQYFISAGFGLVNEDQIIPPYEVTFSSMSKEETRERSEKLGIYSDLIEIIQTGNFDIVFLALGSDYYHSINLEKLLDEINNRTMTVVFNQEIANDFENSVSIPARLEEAKANGSTVVGLKGLYLKNFAKNVDESDVNSLDMIEKYCRKNPRVQESLDEV